MEAKTKIVTRDLNLYYGENHALKNINLELYEKKITAFIGPSGCGKSTYLKTLNRMNDLVPNVKIQGTVLLDGENIYDPQVDTTLLRKKIGMVFMTMWPMAPGSMGSGARRSWMRSWREASGAQHCGMRCRTA